MFHGIPNATRLRSVSVESVRHTTLRVAWPTTRAQRDLSCSAQRAVPNSSINRFEFRFRCLRLQCDVICVCLCSFETGALPGPLRSTVVGSFPPARRPHVIELCSQASDAPHLPLEAPVVSHDFQPLHSASEGDRPVYSFPPRLVCLGLPPPGGGPPPPPPQPIKPPGEEPWGKTKFAKRKIGLRYFWLLSF